jgi:hypothetical protein
MWQRAARRVPSVLRRARAAEAQRPTGPVFVQIGQRKPEDAT